MEDTLDEVESYASAQEGVASVRGPCWVLKDYRLASVLCEKGADLVVGYDRPVTCGYDSDMLKGVMG